MVKCKALQGISGGRLIRAGEEFELKDIEEAKRLASVGALEILSEVECESPPEDETPPVEVSEPAAEFNVGRSEDEEPMYSVEALEGMTKAALMGLLSEEGVDFKTSDTKAQLIERAKVL